MKKSDVTEHGCNFEEDNRIDLLKSYLARLGKGEALDTVRADFVEHFKDVEASEIMRAEQEMMKEGTPLSEVQKLCDLHSALFHGSTTEEQIQKAETAVKESLRKENTQADYSRKKELCKELTEIQGHPLNTFAKENEALQALLLEAKDTHSCEGIKDLINKLLDISVHYAKKGDLLYPHLKVQYQISGPSDVMWTVDDEIRDELSELARLFEGTSLSERAAFPELTEEEKTRLLAVINRMDEMIYKEKNILFPICAVNFTEEEWMAIYFDSMDYKECFGVEKGIWADAKKVDRKSDAAVDEIKMPGGHMSLAQLTALLNTIPMEISFIDDKDINRYFNEGPKVFKRPGMAIDRDVFSCHPPKIEAMVRAILTNLRNGTKDSVPVWMEKNGRTMLVTYMAVRDAAGVYLGTVELVQDMEAAKAHFEKSKK